MIPKISLTAAFFLMVAPPMACASNRAPSNPAPITRQAHAAPPGVVVAQDDQPNLGTSTNDSDSNSNDSADDNQNADENQNAGDNQTDQQSAADNDQANPPQVPDGSENDPDALPRSGAFSHRIIPSQ